MKKTILAAVLLLALLLSQAALAGFNHYAIDVEALKALEATDTFCCRITKKTVTDGANQGVNLHNQDILTLTCELEEGTQEVTGMVVLIVCHDAEQKAVALVNGGLSSISMGDEKRTLQTQVSEGISLTSAVPYQLNIACDHSAFTGARALVAEVTFADGTTLVNPLVEEWQELALGSPTHYLD